MNFFQKGLAGLESRLDKVLLDESERPPPPTPPPEQPRRSTDSRRSIDRPTPTGTPSRMTMQERLAAAVAKKAGDTGAGSGRASGESVRTVDEEKSAEEEPPDPPGVNGGGKAGGAGDKDSGAELDRMEKEELAALVRTLRRELVKKGAESEERLGALEAQVRSSTPDSRKKAAVSGGGGSSDRKLAEAQEKIALLLEEGEKLSRTELKLRNTIKELRLKTQEEEKSTTEARKRAERADRDAAELREKFKKATDESRRDRERLKGVSKLENEISALKGEKEALLAAVAELTVKVEEGVRRAEEAEGRAQTEALESERKRRGELESELVKVKAEKVEVEERLGVEVADLKSKVVRDAERARTAEAEWKGEQVVMERKMEALRARAEEVSSGASGDAHAKLLRQVEMLQTQYAIASENWQGIEGGLMGRIAGLERERDELGKKEAEIRRKARDLSIKSKNLSMDLDAANSKIKDLESDLTISQSTTNTLQSRVKILEPELVNLRSTFDQERTTWQRDLESKLQEERQKWMAAETHASPSSRPSSPTPLTPSYPLRKSSGPLSTTESYFVGARKPLSSRSPTPGFNTPPTLLTRSSLPPPPEDDTDYFDGPFSPGRDMVSVSTVAAGPSVQLVERMSATVRRLESEMAGAREEVAAMARQRDEARAEIVEMVREVEGARGAIARVKELEGVVSELRGREEAMLQLLGERSEEVEELKGDVADLKQMYRDLVNDFGK